MQPKDIVSKYIFPGCLVANRYRVESVVGSGAYGAIFSAIDTVSMERVAVKAVPPIHDGGKKTAIGRFQREMKVIGSLRHPNIITLYDYGETDQKIVFMVLEFIDGATLSDVINASPMNFENALDVTRQIAAALSEAHNKGVVHRDLKPQNVMLIKQRDEYEVKVLDFGMAKVLSRFSDESIEELTREGIAVGTPRYIAPEQARGKEVGGYSDLYALGLLMYEMFTGARAVKADSIESAILAHVSPARLELDEIDQVPKSVRPILFKLIEKKVANRYQSAERVVEDIERLARSASPMAGTIKVDRLDSEETEPKQDRRQKPQPEPPPEQERLRSLASASQLVLDYDRVNHGAVAREVLRDNRFTDREKESSSIREWGEVVFAAITAPVAFTFLTAHFVQSPFPLRVILGSFPAVVAFGVFLFFGRNNRTLRFPRMFFFCNMVGIGIAHLLGLKQLAVGLVKEAAWYLEPFAVIPGVSFFRTVIEVMANQYVGVLIALMPEIGSVVRNLN